MNETQAIENMKIFKSKAAPPSDELKEMMKKNNAVERAIKKALAGQPRTVVQLASETGYATHEVFRMINAMRKYGLVVTGDEAQGYMQYKLCETP